MKGIGDAHSYIEDEIFVAVFKLLNTPLVISGRAGQVEVVGYVAVAEVHRGFQLPRSENFLRLPDSKGQLFSNSRRHEVSEHFTVSLPPFAGDLTVNGVWRNLIRMEGVGVIHELVDQLGFIKQGNDGGDAFSIVARPVPSHTAQRRTSSKRCMLR